MLDQMFHEMAVRSPDDTIAKDTFLKFFDLPGVLGDRLFEVFDTKKTGVIDFEEFMDGYQMFARGDQKMKMDMLFQLFDLDGKGGITKLELRVKNKKSHKIYININIGLQKHNTCIQCMKLV